MFTPHRHVEWLKVGRILCLCSRDGLDLESIDLETYFGTSRSHLGLQS